jgi:hypothetical protein
MKVGLPNDDVNGGTRDPFRRALLQAALGLGALGFGSANADVQASIVPSIGVDPPPANDAVSAFRVAIASGAIEDLRRRLAMTRWCRWEPLKTVGWASTRSSLGGRQSQGEANENAHHGRVCGCRHKIQVASNITIVSSSTFYGQHFSNIWPFRSRPPPTSFEIIDDRRHCRLSARGCSHELLLANLMWTRIDEIFI